MLILTVLCKSGEDGGSRKPLVRSAKRFAFPLVLLRKEGAGLMISLGDLVVERCPADVALVAPYADTAAVV